jgi:hypothetical protein
MARRRETTPGTHVYCHDQHPKRILSAHNGCQIVSRRAELNEARRMKDGKRAMDRNPAIALEGQGIGISLAQDRRCQEVGPIADPNGRCGWRSWNGSLTTITVRTLARLSTGRLRAFVAGRLFRHLLWTLAGMVALVVTVTHVIAARRLGSSGREHTHHQEGHAQPGESHEPRTV